MSVETILTVSAAVVPSMFGAVGKIWGKQPVTHIHNHIEEQMDINPKRDLHIELIPLRTEPAPVPEVIDE